MTDPKNTRKQVIVRTCSAGHANVVTATPAVTIAYAAGVMYAHSYHKGVVSSFDAPAASGVLDLGSDTVDGRLTQPDLPGINPLLRRARAIPRT